MQRELERVALDNVLDLLKREKYSQLDELKALLRIPSISALPEHSHDLAKCAEHIAQKLRQIGMSSTEVISTGGHPIVFSEWIGAPDALTVLLYGHYDVKPVDPIDEWITAPFEPTEIDGRLYARGAADDKGQFHMHIAALGAHLRARGRLPVNVKLLIEGEEEVSSVHLDDFIENNKERLSADVAVISDTPMFAPGLPSICYGLRGIAYVQLEVMGARADLHSGEYGGAIANPLQVLCEIIAGLKDPRTGAILVDGFYDRVHSIDVTEREALGNLPLDDESYRADLAVPRLFGEAGYTTVERTSVRPTLEINGIWGGFTGQGAKTVLPSRASAKISCRLVPDQDPDEIAELLESHIRKIAPPTVAIRMIGLGGGKPAVTPIDHPAVRAASRALRSAFGRDPVFAREGGSIPVVATFDSVLGLKTVLFGVSLPDCGTHAPNEWLDIDSYFKGTIASAHFWEEMSKPG